MKSRLFKLGFLIALGVLVSLVSTSHAKAVTGSDFIPGRIIDDQIFTNTAAMGVSDIQNFLNAKVPTCDTGGNQPFYGTYGGHTYNGNILRKNLDPNFPPPYTCLKDYYENTSTHANNYGGQPIPSGAISAAQIIYNASQQYSINPEVLIVLIQKESSLITDDWPWTNQYRTATGYGCPDGAACDSQYFGFANQVTKAAWQFRLYYNNPGNYSYRTGQNNNILYNPNGACGYETVFIQNQATANLYIYTPYVPNQAALNNLYGTGDGCSSYGNRNFWRLFSDWFGSTLAAPYAAQFAGQSNWVSSLPGNTSAAFLEYKNVGNSPWYDDASYGSVQGALPVHLATSHPDNRASVFGSQWPNHNRPAVTFTAVYEADGSTLATSQHIVQPGQIVKFSFNLVIQDDLSAGVYQEYFRPVLEGSVGGSFNEPNTYLVINVQAAHYTAQFAGQSDWVSLTAGSSAQSYMEYKNTGNMPWYDDSSYVPAPGALPVHLATAAPVNRISLFGDGWANHNRPALNFATVYEANGSTLAGNQHVVQPGQIAKFIYSFTAPINAPGGFYREYLAPVLEGSSGINFNDPGTFIGISLTTAQYVAQYAAESSWPTLNAGGSSAAFLEYKNAGNVPWYDDASYGSVQGALPVHLATSHPDNRASVFGSQWPNHNRPAVTFTAVYEADGSTLATSQHIVQPGQIAKFTFTFNAPTNVGSGRYQEYFRPVLEGSVGGAFNNPDTYLVVAVQ